MDWLTLGIIGGCVMMFATALVWHRYRVRLKADEEARQNAQKSIDVIAEKAKKSKKVVDKEKK